MHASYFSPATYPDLTGCRRMKQSESFSSGLERKLRVAKDPYARWVALADAALWKSTQPNTDEAAVSGKWATIIWTLGNH